jgi:uncharacterized protein YdeI (YjbR/CyaY-like superfamily)
MATSIKGERKCFYAKSRKEWRKWLEKNHQTEKFIWLVIYRKKSKTPSVYYDEAVEEALCFGWIDSKGNERDSESFYLFFAQRNPKSNWSKINKQRVERMTAEGLMTSNGQKLIDLAKTNGTWDAMEEIDNLVIPADLKNMFARNKKAFKNFEAFPPSSKKIILNWILSAKRQETREQRIKQTVELAAKNIKANHYRQ